MAILITWWLWYIWSHTAVVFSQAWYEVVLVDNLSNSDYSVLANVETILGKKIPFYEMDIKNKKWLSDIFSTHTIDAVIHFAAFKAVGESCQNPFLYYENNIGWSFVLFEVMETFGVKKIVFSSSATVYDPDGIPPFTELSPLRTTNPYGTTKLVLEKILQDVSAYKGFYVMCLRYFNPIGAHSSWLIGENPRGIPNNLLPYIYQVALQKQPYLVVFGDDYPTWDGTWVRDYLHVVDLAQAHLFAYEKNIDSHFEIINLWTGTWTSVMEMLTMTREITWKEIPYRISKRRAGDAAVSLADPHKAERLLWWKTSFSIQDAIRDGWNFIQTHSSWK